MNKYILIQRKDTFVIELRKQHISYWLVIIFKRSIYFAIQYKSK